MISIILLIAGLVNAGLLLVNAVNQYLTPVEVSHAMISMFGFLILGKLYSND